MSYWGGYDAYRRGPGKTKPQAHDPVYKGDQRKHIINKIMDLLSDWRFSQFEKEGPVLSGIRSALCLKGYSWDRANREAANLVSSAIMKLGYSRPTWEQGQPDYTTPAENCKWCGGAVDTEFGSGMRSSRFCSEECAKAFITRRDAETVRDASEAFHAAWKTIRRAKHPAISCRECGVRFKPHKGDEKFCSPSCYKKHRDRALEELPCLHCGISFMAHKGRRPDQGKFCSARCALAHRHVLSFERTCQWCGDRFMSKRHHTNFCSHTCSTTVRKAKKGVYPKRLSPPVLDFIFREQGLRVTTEIAA